MRLLLILLIIGICSTAQAANKDSVEYRWGISQSVGNSIPLNDWRLGSITDHLISIDDPSLYWKFIDVMYNVSPKISFKFSFQFPIIGNNKRSEQFANSINNIYKDNYYIKSAAGSLDRKSPLFVDNIERSQIGVLYNIRKNNFIFSPGFTVGLSSFFADFGGASLKEKNTNQYLKIDYSAEKTAKEYMTYIPSLSLSYTISERFDIYAQGSYFINKYNFTYTEEKRNVFKDMVETKKIKYQGTLQTLTIGLGLRYNFG